MSHNLYQQTEHDNANLNSDNQAVSLLTNLIVYYGSDIRITVLTPVEFSSIVDRIRTDEHLKKKIEYVRTFDDETERREVKAATLPHFSMCRFADNHCVNDAFLSTNYLLFDLDHLPDLHAMRLLLVQDETIFCLFLSPSGDGLKFIYRLDREITDEATYRAVYQAQARVIESKYGHKPDTRDDPRRACFLSYDPDIYVNENAVPISTVIVPVSVSQKQSRTSIGSLLKPTTEGNRTPTLVSLVGKLKKVGIPKEAALNICLAWNTKNTPPLPDDKVEYTVSDLYQRYPEVFSVDSIDYTQDIHEIFSALKAAKAADATCGTVLFEWMKVNKNAQYFTDENNNHYIYLNDQLIPMVEGNSDFEALLLTTANLSTKVQLGRVVVQVMNASAHVYGRKIKKNTWLQTDRKNLAVHINLKNEKRELLKITPDACQVVHNGSNDDNVFMLDTMQDKIQPAQYLPMDAAQLKSALDTVEHLVVRHIPAIDHNRWLSFGWLLTYPLYDFTSDHFILRYQGKPEMGKSTATRLHSYWVYGKDCLGIQPTVASMHSDAAVNPLVLDDNLESRMFYADAGRQSFYLGAGTGGTKQKREIGTNSGLITETIRALVLCNGIESIAKSELTSRMMVIECDRELYNSHYTSAVLLDVERNRDLFASTNFLLTQKVLQRIQSGDLQNVQSRLQLEYPKHPKNRMFEHLSIIVLYLEEFFRAAGKTEDVWKILTLWMEEQRELATNEIIGGDPIIQATDLLRESALKQSRIKGDNVPKLNVNDLLCAVQVKANEEVVITGFAGDLLSAFSAAYRVHYNQNFPISNSRVLTNRLDTVKAELKAHGYELVESRDTHRKQNRYMIRYLPGGENKATEGLPLFEEAA